jgi:hypothetical protein
MNEFDQFMKHDLKIEWYARYTDDFVVVSDNAEYLKELLPSIEKFLQEKLRLELHPEKVDIKKFRQGIDFLGHVVLPYHRRLRTKTKKRIFRKLKKKYHDYQNKLVSADSFNQSLQSYLGALSHASAHRTSENIKNMYKIFSG